MAETTEEPAAETDSTIIEDSMGDSTAEEKPAKKAAQPKTVTAEEAEEKIEKPKRKSAKKD